MEPIRPELRERILTADPTAENDIQEYERLLSLRFTRDPDFQAPQPEALDAVDDRSERLRELRRRLAALVPDEPDAF